jgi:hypothetical protein
VREGGVVINKTLTAQQLQLWISPVLWIRNEIRNDLFRIRTFTIPEPDPTQNLNQDKNIPYNVTIIGNKDAADLKRFPK